MKTNDKNQLETVDIIQLEAVTGGLFYLSGGRTSTTAPVTLPNGSVLTTGGNPYGKFISFGSP